MSGEMTQLLQQAMATVSALPDERQDELARILLQLAGLEQPAYVLSPEEIADLEEADAEIARGEFATDDEVAAVWAKYDR
jgi:predicted transcriptional regulator